jgi:formamidopyrimidine-DNA glycosylase
MPERPDLEYVVPILSERLVGRSVASAEVLNPVVMRVAVLGDGPGQLVGATIEAVTRRAHWVVFTLSGELDLVVHPMLAGRFELLEGAVRRRKDIAFILGVGEAQELRYRDDVQMGKVYIVPRADAEAVIPGFGTVGVDVLSRAFTLKAFSALAKTRRDQVKVFLMDKSALDALGNAYADEVLFEAGLHPKLRVRELSEDQLKDLHKAIKKVLRHARDTVARRQPELSEKVRDFLKVRNRKGEPCPRCGTKIRAAGVHGHDAFFCPSCQPDTKGRGFVDWRKLKR